MPECEQFCEGKYIPVDCDNQSECDKFKCLEACRDCRFDNDTICYCPHVSLEPLEKLMPQYRNDDEPTRITLLLIFIFSLLIFLAVALYCLRQWHLRNFVPIRPDQGRSRRRSRVSVEPAAVESGFTTHEEHHKKSRLLETKAGMEKDDTSNDNNIANDNLRT